MTPKPKIFPSRFSTEYRNDVIKRFDVISEEATDVPDETGLYNRRAEIIYAGVSGSILLDLDKAYREESAIADRFKQLIDDVVLHNKAGLYLHVKILFPYPYSEFARQLMIAGGLRERVTLKNIDREVQSFTFKEFVPDYDGNGADFKSYQNNSIRVLEEHYVRTLHLPNRFDVRFTPLPLNYSGLFINKSAYYDLYSYAKMSSTTVRLASRLPIIKVVDQGDRIPKDRVEEDNFKCLLNDFDYLWNHPATMFYKDVIGYDKGSPYIRKPTRIKHHAKIQHMCANYNKNKQREGKPIELCGSWEFAVEQLVRQSTTEVIEILSKETIFIACSWLTASDPHGQPNSHAQKINELLEVAFNDILQINIVNVDQGALVSNEIFEKLDSCSHGIVILSKDLHVNNADGVPFWWYPRPNIPHELGYLCHKLGGYGSKKICILEEVGVKGPSNMANVSTVPFDRDKFYLVYRYVLDWISKEFHTVSVTQFEYAVGQAKNMLTRCLKNHEIKPPEYTAAINDIDTIMNKYRKTRDTERV
jgi:hypothetical protein